jgi:hypothetical protein
MTNRVEEVGGWPNSKGIAIGWGWRLAQLDEERMNGCIE